MSVPRTPLAVVALLLVVPALASAPAAAPPPEGVCGVCGSAFEDSAAAAGVDARVVESDLVIEVDDDGDSRWTANVTLDAASADRFAANRALLERTVARTYDSPSTVVDAPHDLTVAIDDRTVTVTFALDGVAHRGVGGVWLFDPFVQSAGDGAPYVDADRLAVVGPPETAVTTAPDGGTVHGNRVIWTATDEAPYSPRISRPHVVAFAPDDGVLAQASTAVAVRADALQRIAPELRAYALVPATLLAVLAAGLLFAGDRLTLPDAYGRAIATWLAAGVASYVALTVVGAVILDEAIWYVLGTVGLGLVPPTILTAAVGLSFDHADSLGVDRAEPILDVRPPTVATVAVVAWTLALVLGAPGSAVLVVMIGPLAFLPFGVLAGANRPTRFLFPAVAALGPAVAALPFVPRSGVVFVSPGMLALHSILSGLLGVPLFVLGRRLGDSGGSHKNETDRTAGAST